MDSNNGLPSGMYCQLSAVYSAVQKKEPDISLSKKDLIFALIFLADSFLIVDFIFFNGLNTGFTVAFTVLFISLTAYLFDKNSKTSVFSYICGVLSLAGAVTFSLYKDTLINIIMLFLVCALFGIYICGISGMFRYREGSFKMLGDLLGSVFISPFSNAACITGAYGKSISKNKNVRNVIIGIALAVPVLLVIIPLLSGSDAAFENLVKIVIKNIGIYLLEIALAVILTPFVIFYAVSKKHCKKADSCTGKGMSGGTVQSPVTVSFLSVISVTYVIYLFSQLAYFFSAFSGILPEGYTYTASVYARRGFFEMFAICVINTVIIALANILTKRKAGKIPAAVKALSVFILAFTVLILITAMQKMKLNIEIFGMSKNRLLVSVFMLMIMVIIAFYILHIFLPKVSYMQSIIIICSIFFIALSYSDIDAVVAKYNIQAYNDGKIDSLDVDYINSLSDSSVTYVIELADCDDHKIAKEARTIIVQKIIDEDKQIYNLAAAGDYRYDFNYKPDTDFRSYNYAKDKACKTLEEYYNSLSAEDREKLITQYDFDYSGDYYYDAEKDIYESYSGEGCNEYSYNEKTDMYEFSRTYKVSYDYGENDEYM